MTIRPEDIYNIHKQYADEFAQLTQGGLIAAFNALSNSGIYNYTPTGISIKFPNYGAPKDVTGQLPEPPTSPEPTELGPLKSDFLQTPNPNYGSPPANTVGSGPTYVAPVTPNGTPPTLTVSPPPDPTNPTLPTAPTYLTLPALDLPYDTIDIPTAPIITDPVFDGRRPDDISVPDAATLITKYETEQQGHRNMLPAFARETAQAFVTSFVPEYAAVRAKINNAISGYTGGVGIPEQIEGAIMARAGDRASQEFQKALDTAAETMSKRGFSLPPGALQAVLSQSRAAMGDALVRSSTEVATKNLELEQQNFQFMLKLGEALEEKVLDVSTQYLALSLKMDEQAIASAKEIVATYLGAYNLQVLVYKSLWDGYQAAAEVYKARIAANESLVRVYEAEIKAELAKTEVNKAHVEVLQVVAATNTAIVNAYKAQIDAALAPLEVAKVRLALYEARVRAYASETSAFEARWRAYSAQVEGALAPFKAYEARAQAYTAQSQAYRAQVEGYSAQVQAAAEGNKAISVYNDAILRKYTSEVDAKLKEFDKLIAAYSAESSVVVKQAEIEVEYWRTQANLIFQEFNSALNQSFEYAREQMALYQGQLSAAVNAANGLAQAANVAGSLAGSAMSGLSAIGGTFVSSQS